MMATWHGADDGYWVAVKGAAESVLPIAVRVKDEDGLDSLDEGRRDAWRDRNDQMGDQGLRVLALASKTAESVEGDPYEELTLLGLAGLLDPPRKGVEDAIKAAQGAGVRVIMVTGDHPATARYVGQAVGLVEDSAVATLAGSEFASADEWDEEQRQRIRQASILARVSPEQKLDLIGLHQDAGAIVAMTGDGVNDAPALRKADIGIAMGQRGTEVAQEAADIVLQDDALATIVMAIEQGRVIFGNIRKFVLYLLSCNLSEIMIVSLATVAERPLPITPLQILFLNIVTDVFPALALGVGEGDPAVMRRPPRDPDEAVITGRHWISIVGYGALISVAVLGVFWLSLDRWQMETSQAVTISFMTLALAQLWHVFNMRDVSSGMIRNSITRNPWVWGALVLCTALLAATIWVPGLANVLSIVHPEQRGWLAIAVGSVAPLIVGQLTLWIRGLVARGRD
jgi:Ca2+-transporting ATPase